MGSRLGPQASVSTCLVVTSVVQSRFGGKGKCQRSTNGSMTQLSHIIYEITGSLSHWSTFDIISRVPGFES